MSAKRKRRCKFGKLKNGNRCRKHRRIRRRVRRARRSRRGGSRVWVLAAIAGALAIAYPFVTPPAQQGATT